MLKRIALLFTLCVWLASAKTYTFTLSSPGVAGDKELSPGTYKIKLEGDKISILDRDGRPLEVKARLESAQGRFPYTAVATAQKDGKTTLQYITLAGTNSRVVFE